MPSVLRYQDSAGGQLGVTSSGSKSVINTTVFANSKEIIVDGDIVKPHGSSPHNAATIIAGSNNVFIGNVAVANSGDLATCGDTGSSDSNVHVGD